MDDRMSAVYSHDPNIVSRSIAGETILVPIRKSVGEMDSLYTLNETGARIWELIDGQRTLAEVGEQVLAEFDVQADQAQGDLLELVEALLERGALVKS